MDNESIKQWQEHFSKQKSSFQEEDYLAKGMKKNMMRK